MGDDVAGDLFFSRLLISLDCPHLHEPFTQDAWLSHAQNLDHSHRFLHRLRNHQCERASADAQGGRGLHTDSRGGPALRR